MNLKKRYDNMIGIKELIQMNENKTNINWVISIFRKSDLTH